MKKNMMSGDYFKLFVRREGRVVLGKNFSSLWLLTAVLTLTLLAISFSNASMNYLSFKMNDPFINWVEIQNTGEDEALSMKELVEKLRDSVNMSQFNYVECNVDVLANRMFFGKEDQMIQYLSIRGFASFSNNPIIDIILDDDNIVGGAALSPDTLDDKMVGVIIKDEILDRLGYDEIPAFVDYACPVSYIEDFGIEITDKENHAVRSPIPVLAVVKRLPGNANMVATNYCLEQFANDKLYPLNPSQKQHAVTAHYFVPGTIDPTTFKKDLEDAYGMPCYVKDSHLPQLTTWAEGTYIQLRGEYGADIEPMEIARVNRAIMSKYAASGVKRVYDIECGEYKLPGSYVSVQFSDLSKIRDFEQFVRSEYKYKIEMEQVNAKENFNAVSVMAGILSWAIVGFSIICIVLFIVNLFQSYFQKVKRNLGTFKAFGISNRQLVGIYLLIIFSIIMISIVISLALAFAAELLLPMFGIMMDGAFNYLALNSSMTWIAVSIILVSSILTVYLVMRRLLSATPGNLIYDR